MSQENKAPVHRIRLSSISASIFRNENADVRTYYNAQFDRSYKDGDDWKHTKSFDRDDLLNLAKVADLTHSWIHTEQQSESKSSELDTPEPS